MIIQATKPFDSMWVERSFQLSLYFAFQQKVNTEGLYQGRVEAQTKSISWK